MKKKRITKKIASEIFRKVIGTDKGMTKYVDVIEHWTIKAGMIEVTCDYESDYSHFTEKSGKHIEVRIITENQMDYIYFEPDTLEMDREYTFDMAMKSREAQRAEYLESIPPFE